MTPKFGTYSLFLTIILWGILVGAIHYSHLIYFSVYLSNLPDSAIVVNGVYAVRDTVFWQSIHPILIFSLFCSLALNWKSKERRTLIVVTMTVYALALLITFIYFVPELIAFQGDLNSSGVSRDEWLMRGHQWQRLSWIRGAFITAAILPLLIAATTPADKCECRKINKNRTLF